MRKAKTNAVSNDMNSLVKDAKNLFHEASAATGEKAAELRERAMAMLDNATSRSHEMQASAVARSKQMAHDSADYARHHPWRIATVLAGAGLLLGVLMSRKSGTQATQAEAGLSSDLTNSEA